MLSGCSNSWLLQVPVSLTCEVQTLSRETFQDASLSLLRSKQAKKEKDMLEVLLANGSRTECIESFLAL